MEELSFDVYFSANSFTIGISSSIEYICDTSDIVLGNSTEIGNGLFNLKNTSFTKSLNKNEYMSICYSYCVDSGLNICIHFPETYNMENFVECFQSFIEE